MRDSRVRFTETYPRLVYTRTMLEKLKANQKYILIGLGALLIVVGLTSNFVTFLKNQAPEITGAFRFVEKLDQTQKASSQNENKVETTQVETNILIKNSLDVKTSLVHPVYDKSLEVPLIPDKIEIPAIGLSAPIEIAEFNFTDLEGETFGQWISAAEFAGAWHPDSALLGSAGNTVINGHHNLYGKVFGKLVDLESGDMVYIYAKGKKYTYVIANKMILLEKGQPLDVRMENARWLEPTDDERLTLVTCWPAKSNTHRLILVARPVQ
jgi:LPXTG-site transpeptidase (sortase) family protein